MPTDPAILELLDDAKRVADHGARTGSFSRDEPLYGALQAAEVKAAEGTLSWADPAFAAVQQALSPALRAIQPVTLFDLKSGWRADVRGAGKAYGFRRGVTMGLVLVFTVMTLMLCAFATTWQQRAKQNQVELARKDAELQALAYDALFPLIMSLGTEDRSKVADPSSGVRQALRDSVRKIEALEASMLADVVAYKALEQRHPFTTSRDVLASVPKKVLDLFGPLGARSANASVDDAPAKPPAAPPDAASTATHGPCDAPTLQASIDALGKLPEDASSVAIFESVRKHDLALLAKFRCDLELDDLADRLDLDADETLLASLQFSLLDAAPSLKVHDAWALPMLYGMLGALIYHLRNYLNNLRPDPSFVLVVMRVFLGGFAGIAIGWFWRPENGEALGVADITLSTLSLAFLVGFAIDVFLKLLDRLVTLVSGWVGNLGAAR